MKIPPWPFFEQDEINKVSDILKSGKVNYWTGQETKIFEKEAKKYTIFNHYTVLNKILKF